MALPASLQKYKMTSQDSQVVAMTPVAFHETRVHDGLMLVKTPSCPCDVEEEKRVLLGLRKKHHPLSVNTHDIPHIMRLMEVFLLHNNELKDQFETTSAPLDFEMEHPCWGCWLQEHLDCVELEGSSLYSKDTLCNSGVTLIRFLILAFTALRLSESLELVCDDQEDLWSSNLYSCVKKWYDHLE